VAYLMDEIDERSTQRRLDEITAAGVQALEQHAERSAEIDEEFREALARQRAEAKAMDELVAEAHAAQKAAQPDAESTAPAPWVKREPKPSVLSFGGEEFADETPTPPAGSPSPPTPPPLVAPQLESTPPVRESKDHFLSLGVDEDEPPAPPRPAASAPPAETRRPAADEQDDDWSDTSWIR
jgi:hypothetical protein